MVGNEGRCTHYGLQLRRTYHVVFTVVRFSEEAVYIHAVQALLLIRSPVFFSMFTGELAVHTEQPPVIDVPDIEPEAFKEMLRYYSLQILPFL